MWQQLKLYPSAPSLPHANSWEVSEIIVEMSDNIGQLDFKPYVKFVRLKMALRMEHRDFSLNAAIKTLPKVGTKLPPPLSPDFQRQTETQLYHPQPPDYFHPTWLKVKYS